MNTQKNQAGGRQQGEFLAFQARFQKLFASMPAAVFSRHGRVTHLNAAAERVLGLTLDAVRDRTLSAAGFKVTDENGMALPARGLPWQRARQEQTARAEDVIGLIRPDGERRWLQCACAPFREDARGRTQSVVAILSDLTRFARLRSQSLQAQKMEAIGALTGGIAHDFNNILSSIRSAAQLSLLDAGLSVAVREAIFDIEAETIRGAELVKQLLLFSRPAETRRKSTALNEAVRRLRHLLRRTFPKTIRIETHLPPHPIRVQIGPTQLEQLVLNLCLNARDAMPAGGELVLRASLVPAADLGETEPRAARKTYARLDISDTGVGIPPETLPKVFDPFFTSKEDHGGTGLGLAIVDRIVRQAGGKIQAESAPGKGTTMTVHLPARRTRADAKPGAPARTEPMVAGYETVLLADDEPVTLKSTARFLERYGYRTLTAGDGHEALDLFRRHRQDIRLTLMDYEMPDMTGADCLAAIRQEKPSMKAVLLSGHPPSERGAAATNADAFLQKPFDFQRLLTIIRQVLDG